MGHILIHGARRFWFPEFLLCFLEFEVRFLRFSFFYAFPSSVAQWQSGNSKHTPHLREMKGFPESTLIEVYIPKVCACLLVSYLSRHLDRFEESEVPITDVNHLNHTKEWCF